MTEKHFDRLLNGQSKAGHELVQPGVNNIRRSGYDYTFTTPKSFSILTELLASNELKQQLYEAHDRAVKTVLDYLEKHYAQARITLDGETRTVDTGNLLYATFTENTSREQDPQIHTHAVIFNITRRGDGEYRAIMNEPIHNNKMFLGQLYRNELAKQVDELGLAIELKPKGLFEIKGIPEEEFLLTSKDGLVGIQGDAGTGKTTMLALAAEEYRSKGYQVVTLAPTAKAVEELRLKKMPNAETLQSFLVSSIDKTNGQPRVFIIDEASMLGSKQLSNILKRTKSHDRVVLVGDTKQKQSLAAGAIFGKLQEHKVMRTARMAENIRQKNPLSRQIVNQLAEKKVREAFDKVDENKKIQVVEDSFERLRVVADEYLKTYQKKDTLTIVESNAERKYLNNIIREQLLEQGRLGRAATATMTQQPSNVALTERQLSRTSTAPTTGASACKHYKWRLPGIPHKRDGAEEPERVDLL